MLASDPALNATCQRIERQLDNSDDGTIAQYDRALSSFIETGDTAALAPVAGMAARDAVEQAIHDGEISREDAEAGAVDWTSIGLDPEDVREAFAEAPATAAPAEPQAPERFGFVFGQDGKPAAPAKPQAAPQQPATMGAAPRTVEIGGKSYIVTAEGGYRPAPAGAQARREAGTALPSDRAFIRSAEGGYRPAPTGAALARETGVPLASIGLAPDGSAL